jgi:hypothetical protein
MKTCDECGTAWKNGDCWNCGGAGREMTGEEIVRFADFVIAHSTEIVDVARASGVKAAVEEGRW